MLCALDLAERSRHVLEWALFFAGECQAQLGIFHAMPFIEAPPFLAEARGRIAKLLGPSDTNAMVLVDGGEPGAAVARAAREFHADVLVIGRHSGGSDQGDLRHNDYAIIRESPCPVISI